MDKPARFDRGRMKTQDHNLAVVSIWYERYLECSRTHGTQEFIKSVWRFYHSLLNIGDDKLAIKNIVREYINDTWYPYVLERVEQELQQQGNISMGAKQKIKQLVMNEEIVKLFEHIIQTIQDSGRGWPTKEEIETYKIIQE